LCEATRDDKRTPWEYAVEQRNIGWLAENKDLREFDQMSIAERYLNWYEIPKIQGFTFYKQRGYLQGIGTQIQNELEMEARSCIICKDKYLNFDEGEYIRKVELTGSDQWGISTISITTNKRSFGEFSDKHAAGKDKQIYELEPSQRVIGFKSFIEYECVRYWAPNANEWWNEETACFFSNMFGLSVLTVDLNDFEQSQADPFDFSIFSN